MQLTIYRTPVFKQILKAISLVGLKLTGWRVVGTPPSEAKYVLIAAPHTSNWDFPLLVAMACVLDFEIYWMGKESLFPKPFAPLVRWLGGISIDRDRAHNRVDLTIKAYNDRENLKIVIPPSGTRTASKKWRSGFYHIAVGANVPLGLGFLDFAKKEGGFLGTYYPTGDIEQDLPEIQEFYKNVKGKNDN